jgi:hypothetical protein
MNGSRNRPFNVAPLGSGADEFIEALAWGLQTVGQDVKVRRATVDAGAINILFAGFFLNYHEVLETAPWCLNFNLEQIGARQSAATNPTYYTLMKNLPNWDYSLHNMSQLKQCGITDVQHVWVGYSPVLERIEPQHKDIDVVFYGSRNPRRTQIIESIKAKGLKVVWTDNGGWTNEQRDEYISRAKVVLNLAFFEDVHILEEVRISYLLNNRVAVVSECRPSTLSEGSLFDCIAGGGVELLPEICAELCANETKRQELADRGYEVHKSRDWLAGLDLAVRKIQEAIPAAGGKLFSVKQDVPTPQQLNLGSNESWKFDFLNLDVQPGYGADLPLDLGIPFDFDHEYTSWRFGRVRLAKGFFKYILAEDFMEKVSNLTHAMTTCLEWLEPGGILELKVVHDLSPRAWEHPATVRLFNEKSWACFTEKAWQIGWAESRFELVKQTFVLTALGQQLHDANVPLDQITCTPRAIDSLHVKLQKRLLSETETANWLERKRPVAQ